MSQRLLCGGFILCILVVARLTAASNPLVLVDPSGPWQERAVGRPFGRGMTFETVVSAADSKGRLLVFSSDAPIDSSASLDAFADQVQSAFVSYQKTKAVEQASDAMGFSGLQYDFELVNQNETVACTLFVFANERRPWGVLSAAPKNIPSVSRPRFDLLRKRTPSDPVPLEPFQVKDSPLISYPIGFQITRDRKANHVQEIVVSDVPAGSVTEEAGVKPGDVVVRINGRTAQSFGIGADRDSELGRIFIDRPPGETVELELLSADTRKSYRVTLHSGWASSRVPKFKLAR